GGGAGFSPRVGAPAVRGHRCDHVGEEAQTASADGDPGGRCGGMTRHFSSGTFDEKTAHPLRSLPRAGDDAQSRAGALLITVLIHVGVIVAFIVGVHVAAPILAPPVLMVHIDTLKKEKLDLAVPPPALLRPTMITAPPPEVEIQVAPRIIAATPPVEAAPPPAIAAPVAQQGQ